MLEFLDAPDSVIAIRVSHKIVGDELDAIMDRLDQLMQRHDKVHLFVETHSIDGIELSSLGRYSARAMLKQFGRVAVVADQAWIRWGTRLESALLPFISYRTFGPEDRDTAMDWVTNDAP